MTVEIVGPVAETPTVVAGSSRTVRLFGVNLECHSDVVEPPPCPDAYNGQHIYYYSTPHPMVNLLLHSCHISLLTLVRACYYVNEYDIKLN